MSCRSVVDVIKLFGGNLDDEDFENVFQQEQTFSASTNNF